MLCECDVLGDIRDIIVFSTSLIGSISLPDRLENSRDDVRLRADILEREVLELQHRNEDLTSLAQEAQTLKDEMDILR